MGDSVQYALDRMVADLEDLRYRGIFSEVEIRAIVAKRRDFEYMLRRHEARKLDFMRYAEHELNLESLRALRTKKIEGSSAANNKKRKKKSTKGGAASDYTCIRLVRWIFDRAVMKFPGDVDIWLHYIDFAARLGQSKTLGRLCARALQLHPRNAGLWIKAASWEFFDGGNASSARALMQRGLRINPSTQQLWLQYFRLEFCYVQKIMGRREVLGLDHADGSLDDNATSGDDSRVEAMDIPPVEGESVASGGTAGGPTFKAVRKATAAAASAEAGIGGAGSIEPAGSLPAVMNDTARKFYKGAVPLAVYRAAVLAVPDDVQFRGSFLRCCAVDFPQLGDEVVREILSSIAEDFPDSCEAWEVRALYPLLVAQGSTSGDGGGMRTVGEGMTTTVQECVNLFESAVDAVGERQPEMWVRYAEFLRERMEGLDHKGEEGASREGRRGDDTEKAEVGSVKSLPIVAVADLARRLHEVLARAVTIHLNVEALASSAEGTQAKKQNRETQVDGCREHDDAREALSAGLADVCLALSEPELALSALCAATYVLPQRSGPWLRRAALERRLDALALDREDAVGGSSTTGGVSHVVGGKAIQTLRAGLKVVPRTSPDYPSLWRELLACVIAAGGVSSGGNDPGSRLEKRKTAVEAEFRAAVEACDPSGGANEGVAQGEFLAGYLRWIGAVQGVSAVRRVMQWARRSFLLSGTGAAVAYNEAIELERTLDGGGTERAKRIRELFEDAADKFGKAMPGIWEEYALFELREGDVKRANAVRWRAKQNLPQVSGSANNGNTAISSSKRRRGS